MLKCDWPGNVRELKNAVERAMILEEREVLNPDYLPFAVAQQQASYTAFEMSSGSSDNGGSATELPNGRSLPKLFKKTLPVPERGKSRRITVIDAPAGAGQKPSSELESGMVVHGYNLKGIGEIGIFGQL